MRKLMHKLHKFGVRLVITPWAYIMAIKIAMPDYLKHCRAWGLDEDKEYYDQNVDYWGLKLLDKALATFPKRWIELMDEDEP